MAAFCQCERISAWNLYDWRKRLRRLGTQKAVAEVIPTAQEPETRVVDLGAFGHGGAAAGRCEIQLDLGGGVVLYLVRS